MTSLSDVCRSRRQPRSRRPGREVAAGEDNVTKMTAIKLSANYIRLELAEDRGMWEYEVRFAPPVDSKDERHKLIQQHR